jgi:3-phosphoshikimate 1-carboxyvinyltransferase
MDAAFRAPGGVGGDIAPPPDKSITHRALLLAAVSAGRCRIRGSLQTGDCLSTRTCLEALGVVFEASSGALALDGVGLRGFREPARVLDAENSGTTTRLLAGLLAGLSIYTVLTGDASLARRPMARVVEPLRRMGARIEGRDGGRLVPLCFLPGPGSLRPIEAELPVASAQVKSALLLAALRAEGTTVLTGKTDSRDHTERMLAGLGVALRVSPGRIEIDPVPSLPGFDLEVPGDVSSAAFFLAAAAVSGRELLVRDCGLNPTRLGILEVLRRMGASVDAREERAVLGEPVGSIRLRPAPLAGTVVSPEEVPGLIDEIPLVAVLGLAASGVTEVRGAGELRAKESDRLAAIARMAESLGGRIELFDDGFRVEGPQDLRPGTVDPGGDHRIAMAAAVSSPLVRGGTVRVLGAECTAVSYPDFAGDFRRAGGEAA